jgi:hypothetical protein
MSIDYTAYLNCTLYKGPTGPSIDLSGDIKSNDFR